MKPQKVNMNNQLFAIKLLMVCLVIVVWLITPICYATDPEDLPWSNESDIIILPWSNETEILPMPPITPPLPPFFSDFNITPTEIVLGDDLIISFVIENSNNRSITWLSTTRIGDITQIIEIKLEAYESKIIWYRIIPHIAREYDVWIDGQTGTFKVISTEIIVIDPLEELNEQIDYLNTTLQDLTTEFFSLQTDYNVDVDELNSKIDTMETTLETYSNDFNEQIESLEDKTSRLQATIMFAFLAIAASVIGGFYFIKRMRARARKI